MFFLKLVCLIPVWAPSKAFLFNMILFHDEARRTTVWKEGLNFNNPQIEKKKKRYWEKKKKKHQQQASNETERSNKEIGSQRQVRKEQ